MSGDYTAKTNLYDVRRSVYYCPKLGEKTQQTSHDTDLEYIWIQAV